MDPRTARQLINRFERLPHAIVVVFSISTPCFCEMYFQGPRGIKITSADRGASVKLKQKLEEATVLGEDAGVAAEARDRAHALRHWLILLYDYNPRYFESPSEGTFWLRNFPLASIEYLQEHAFGKPGRPPKGRASDGATFDVKTLRGDLPQAVFAMRYGISRSTIQRLESGSPLSPKISEKIRKATQSTLDDSNATRKEKALAREILKRLGGTTTRP